MEATTHQRQIKSVPLGRCRWVAHEAKGFVTGRGRSSGTEGKPLFASKWGSFARISPSLRGRDRRGNRNRLHTCRPSRQSQRLIQTHRIGLGRPLPRATHIAHDTALSAKARGRIRSRDSKHSAKLREEEKIKMISPQPDVGCMPDGSVAYMFIDGSKYKDKPTFPSHPRRRGMMVMSVHDMKIYGGENGWMYQGRGKTDPDFIVCPQDFCMDMLNWCPELRAAFHGAIDVHRETTDRKCMIVGDEPSHIYVGNFGVVRPLGQKGILEFSRHKKRLEVEMYNDLVRFTARLEKIVIKYLPRYIHRFMARAKDAVQYTSMRGIDLDSSEEPKYYSSIACGINLVLSMHTDIDAAFCAVVAFKLDYTQGDKERTLVYFTFPGLGSKGMSVQMRHGQVVIFNARQVSNGRIDLLTISSSAIEFDLCLPIFSVPFHLFKEVCGRQGPLCVNVPEELHRVQ